MNTDVFVYKYGKEKKVDMSDYLGFGYSQEGGAIEQAEDEIRRLQEVVSTLSFILFTGGFLTPEDMYQIGRGYKYDGNIYGWDEIKEDA